VRRVERAIRQRRLLAPGESVLAAVSGGADSVFLLLALSGLAAPLGLRLEVAHVNHGWRGAAAAADAEFVEALAERLRLPFHLATVDAPALARRARLAPEDAARRLRYEVLRDVSRVRGIGAVATGHTADDQVETALLGWLRGSGVGGLAGMPWAGPFPAAPTVGAESIRVVRPLLGVGREDIRAALRQAGEAWREDETNAQPNLLRNRVRAELVPLLESLAPGIRATVLRSLDLARQAHIFLQRHATAAAAALFTVEPTEPMESGAAGGGADERRPPRWRAARLAFLQLEPELRGPTLRAAAAQLAGSARDLEWAHVEGALATIERGRGGAVAWLSPGARVRLERGWIVLEAGAGAAERHPAPLTDGGPPAAPAAPLPVAGCRLPVSGPAAAPVPAAPASPAAPAPVDAASVPERERQR
jgi:tRNA(Ile)-lysidine synthase